MLTSTFRHLKGVGAVKEATLWQSGILTWDDYDRSYRDQFPLFALANGQRGHPDLDESRAALQRRDASFFARLLPTSEHYRIALTFPDQTIFLDIETTGLSGYYDYVTLVGAGWSDNYVCHLRGDDRARIRDALANAKCIVTFNGTLFDLPFLRREFPDVPLPEAHVDLRFLAARIGLRGGQKTIEGQIGLSREENVRAVTGYTAVLLWHDYKSGDQEALRNLVRYNHADVHGMKTIFDHVVGQIVEKTASPLTNLERVNFGNRIAPLRFSRSSASLKKNMFFLRPYRGRKGPQISWRQLASDKRIRSLRVVGIDLTGSESRPTGWCLLEGSRAHTMLLRSDEDIVQATLDAQPELISIDSPLSLPKGRKIVTDDDPGRKQYGIMRECERTLKRRGVNVYPSLLPSMQQLTKRGIRLAQQFRERGLPVIESYPGAAQDIIGIPRKGASLDHLKRGLGEFGIRGKFLATKVSHDEVDAVTSALVGVFFWTGKFEALGNPDEDYLIIPDLNRSPVDWRSRRVIGISGPIAAGKTTVGEYLRDRKGFAYGRFSQVLERLLKERGVTVGRTSLQQIGMEIHRSPGQRWLCRELVAGLPPEKRLVIDGMRFPEDRAYLAESFGPAFFHVHIDAPTNLRRRRYQRMGFSLKQFDSAASRQVEMQIGRLATLATRSVMNDKSIRRLKLRMDRLINSLAGEKRGSRRAGNGHRRRSIRLRGKRKGRARVRKDAERHSGRARRWPKLRAHRGR